MSFLSKIINRKRISSLNTVDNRKAAILILAMAKAEALPGISLGGTVVFRDIHKNGNGYTIDIVNKQSETKAILSVTHEEIAREILSWRKEEIEDKQKVLLLLETRE